MRLFSIFTNFLLASYKKVFYLDLDIVLHNFLLHVYLRDTDDFVDLQYLIVVFVYLIFSRNALLFDLRLL